MSIGAPEIMKLFADRFLAKTITHDAREVDF
jgi:hypothetical protein